MGFSTIGKDEEGRYWFKSDCYLTDVTDAHEFYVEATGLFTWKKWLLYASVVKRPGYYRDDENKRGYVPPIIETKQLGEYPTQAKASFALDQLMRLKKIREVDLLE